MKIGLSSDHGAFEYKEILKKLLQEEGHEVTDFGCCSVEAVDYTDTAAAVARSVASGENEKGIVMCGTGIGASISANKIKGIRCALCSEPTSARLTREHNDSNVLAMGQRMIGVEMMKDIVHAWLYTDFSNGERHKRRIDKIAELEKSSCTE